MGDSFISSPSFFTQILPFRESALVTALENQTSVNYLSHASPESLKSRTDAIKCRSREHTISSEEIRFAAFNRILIISRVVSNKFLGIPNSINGCKCSDDKIR